MATDKELLLKQLNPLIDSISEFKKDNFLQPTSTLFDAVLTNCIKLLENNSFSITKCESFASSIKDLSSLVNHYYNLLRLNRSDILPYRDMGADLATAKSLVKNIGESYNFNRQNSIDFSAKLVYVLFEYASELKLNNTSLSMFRGVFGQKKMGWVTERLISCINNEECQQARLAVQADKDTEDYIKLKNPEFGWFNKGDLKNG